MNVLVLSDNKEILEMAKPVFLKRKVQYCFTDSDYINPKLDYKHIIKVFDLVFSLHCKKIFPKELVEGVRCINVHPGFNPYNRGMFPHVWSIVNGMSAGVTIHEMSERIDLGPCICQHEEPVYRHDTSSTLYARILKKEIELLDKWLDDLIDNNYQTFSYNSEGNYNSLQDFKDLCDVDRLEFREAFDTFRALSHGDYWNAHIGSTYLKLIINENGNNIEA